MGCSKHKWDSLHLGDDVIAEWCSRCGVVRKKHRYLRSDWVDEWGWKYYRPTNTYPKKKKLPPMPKTLECIWILYTAKGNVYGTYASLSQAIHAAYERGFFYPKFSVERFDRVSGSTKTYDHATTKRPKVKGRKEAKLSTWILYDAEGVVFGSDYYSRVDAWDDAVGPRFRPRFRITKYEYVKGSRRYYNFRGTCDD